MITENIKYSEILIRNNDLTKSLTNPAYEILLLSNIIISKINEILEIINSIISIEVNNE